MPKRKKKAQGAAANAAVTTGNARTMQEPVAGMRRTVRRERLVRNKGDRPGGWVWFGSVGNGGRGGGVRCEDEATRSSFLALFPLRV